MCVDIYLANLPLQPSAEQLCHVLQAVLDQHAPLKRRLVSDRPPSPWYNAVGPESKTPSVSGGELRRSGVPPT